MTLSAESLTILSFWKSNLLQFQTFWKSLLLYYFEQGRIATRFTIIHLYLGFLAIKFLRIAVQSSMKHVNRLPKVRATKIHFALDFRFGSPPLIVLTIFWPTGMHLVWSQINTMIFIGTFISEIWMKVVTVNSIMYEQIECWCNEREISEGYKVNAVF